MTLKIKRRSLDLPLDWDPGEVLLLKLQKRIGGEA